MELQQLDEVNQIEKGAATFELLLDDKSKWDVRWPSLDQAKPWVSQLYVQPQLLPNTSWPTRAAASERSFDNDTPHDVSCEDHGTDDASSDGGPVKFEQLPTQSEPQPRDRRAAAAERRKNARRR